MSAELDKGRVDAFAGHLLDVLSHGFLCHMFSIGHQTGLFDKMAELPASTSAEIARATQLTERYVREWLGSMTTAKVVEYDARTQTYKLPPAHAASLTRAAGPENLAMLTQYVAELGKVEQPIVECFRKGGGVPYSAYQRWQKLQCEETGQLFDAMLIDGILPLVEGMRSRLEAGIRVLDVGCGSGHAMNLMAKSFPNSHFSGYDISDEGIAAARGEATAMGLKNTEFQVMDAARIDASAMFDFITAFDAIHDQAHPARVLAAICNALRPDGRFLMVDVAASSDLAKNLDHPLGSILYAASTLHCMPVSLAANGEGLGAMWGEEKARQMLAEAGFKEVEVRRIEGDIQNNYYICRH